MGIKFVKEGNACERCRKQNTEVGKMTHYTKHGLDELLCSECINKIEEEYNLKCTKCGELIRDRGGKVTYEGQEICRTCMLNLKKKEVQVQEIKSFPRKHWKWLISTAIGIIFGIFAIFQLS